MDETITRDLLIQKIDALLLKLTDFEESLLITADGDSLYVTGSKRGKNFLEENQYIAEEFHKYCYGNSEKSSKCISLWKQKFSIGKEPSSKYPVYVKPAFTVYNLNNNDEEDDQTEICNFGLQQKRNSSFQVFDIASQSYPPHSSSKRPKADSLVGTKGKPTVNQDNLKNYEVKVCKGSKKTQIKVSPIKVKSGQSQMKGINLDLGVKSNHADSKRSQQPGNDETDITVIDHSEGVMAEEKKKGSPKWSPKIVIKTPHANKARVLDKKDSTKPEEKVIATSKAVCTVKDSYPDEQIKTGCKLNLAGKGTSKCSDVVKESNQSKGAMKETPVAGSSVGDNFDLDLESDLDQELPEPMDSDDAFVNTLPELSDNSFTGEIDLHIVQETSVSNIKHQKSKQRVEKKSSASSKKMIVNDAAQHYTGLSSSEIHDDIKQKTSKTSTSATTKKTLDIVCNVQKKGLNSEDREPSQDKDLTVKTFQTRSPSQKPPAKGSKKRKNTTPSMRSPHKKIKVEMSGDAEPLPAEPALQDDGECGPKLATREESPEQSSNVKRSMETSEKRSLNIASAVQSSSSVNTVKEMSDGSLTTRKPHEEVAREDVNNSPKSKQSLQVKSAKIHFKQKDAEGAQKKYLVVSLEKIPDTDNQQQRESVVKTSSKMQEKEEISEMTGTLAEGLKKSDEKYSTGSVHLIEESKETSKTASLQNTHGNKLSSKSKQPKKEKVDTTASETEKNSYQKGERLVFEPKNPSIKITNSQHTETKPHALASTKTCSPVSKKSEQEKTDKPLSDIKGNNTAKAFSGKKVIDFKNFAIDLRALAVQMAKEKKKKN